MPVRALIVLAAGQLLALGALADGGGGSGRNPTAARERSELPLWASVLFFVPPPMSTPAHQSQNLLTQLSTMGRGLAGRRRGQEVGHAERAEREERPVWPTSCPKDTRPLFALVQRWSSQLPTRCRRLPARPARLRPVYRPETVRLTQARGCASFVLDHVLYSGTTMFPLNNPLLRDYSEGSRFSSRSKLPREICDWQVLVG